MLNHFLPTVSIMCYFLPIAHVYALYIFQKASSQRVLGLSFGLLDMLFLSFRRVVNVIYSFLGNSPASEI